MGLEERRRREKESRRGAILKAARKLFLERGFRAVTVDDIAKKAEISKGAVYLHFKSKEEMYAQILLNDVAKFHQAVTDQLANGRSAADNLLRFSQVYVDFFLKERELFRILMTYMLHTNNMSLRSEIDSQIVGATNKTMEIIEDIFKKGMETGEFPPGMDLRLKRNAVWGFLNGIISLHLFTGREQKREERIRSTITATLEIFIRGLKAPRED
ncbi:MAG TPA: TetR/AcrR family transcriptional regulator [Syntrophales bacterium]|nr:TetR/AcrR family transcriptional regulator [Syntrophales bacterium]HOM07676.1 TetR/AcrR family transcriptional regulator [Syntrophales bacterium]HOO00458.1 TetR/AcrR family transcriptional regulator [Syntrophales bacterium]HPC00832.1 TetR/AcrR family transcriptional regulator [Syntrophales bacterium]HPQ07401.1 TetR/AcrR family transcriptional regulator [Syntrophales bacterium]